VRVSKTRERGGAAEGGATWSGENVDLMGSTHGEWKKMSLKGSGCEGEVARNWRKGYHGTKKNGEPERGGRQHNVRAIKGRHKLNRGGTRGVS